MCVDGGCCHQFRLEPGEWTLSPLMLRCFLKSKGFLSFFFFVNYFESTLFFSAFLAKICPQEFLVFELAVSALGICHFLALHFYLLISSHSSWTPSSSLHHGFSFLHDPVCLYQTWSRHVISDGQCCWCLDILSSLTSNTLALPTRLALHILVLSPRSLLSGILSLPFAFLTLNQQKVWTSVMHTSPPTEALGWSLQLTPPLQYPHCSPLFCLPNSSA